MKRGAIAAVMGALVGLGVAGMALGLPIDPAASSVDSTAEHSASFAPETSDADQALRFSSEGSAGTLDSAPGKTLRVFTFGEIMEVPEPDTAVLFGLGMILLGVVGRRRGEAATSR